MSEETTLNPLLGGYTYGWNYLTSATKIYGKRGKVEFLGVVNYKDGIVPRERWGTTDACLGVSIIGIIGTGDFKKAQGRGTMTGSRASTLGSPVAMKFNLTLKK
ncbi:MAG: hypothetical protein OSA11_06325 [Candidatus Nanopelagicales bacterium]|nr:hypothetical protein [Candidatus Nanopelagicales bacterium]